MRGDILLSDYIESLPVLPCRPRTGHKGTFGTVLGIGGSRGMAGAMALAGRAGLVSGAGLVRLAVPDPILETVAGFYPELTTLPCPADDKGRFGQTAFESLLSHITSVTAIFLGPGLGRSDTIDLLIPLLLRNIFCPLVVDADALNALASFGTEPLDRFFQSLSNKNIILTPHSGELARLRRQPTYGEDNKESQMKRIVIAKDFAEQHGVVLVLKGHETIVTNGKIVALNPTGNPGMATGGSGDILTGILSALLAQGLVPFDAARVGVFLHGLAGDFAADRLGEESVTATSILESIPEAFQTFKKLSHFPETVSYT
ncbi:MAG: NAD(P)H-hydrate dehydratase [Planctomycetaceae bacterium]|jgi:NAD(P)H-hydrate epimerase|nr:NAD(P)H-hydrate dehydratase [Planctomycetaceae bacterium]